MGLLSYIKHQYSHDGEMRRRLEQAIFAIEELKRQNQIIYLRDKALFDTLPGISETQINGEDIVVSLTTFGHRINDVYLAIESIMQGSVKPNKIILWLTEGEYDHIPTILQNQEKRGLQIMYFEDIKSYMKILPSMVTFPDSVIVTIDDDVMYDFDFLERLVTTHKANPDDVCACRLHRITMSGDKMNKYSDWDIEIDRYDKTNLNFLTGVGGVLYPPHCFCEEFFNIKSFMEICRYADDVWINAMIWLSGRSISKVYTRSRRGRDYMDISINIENALSQHNVNYGGNDTQLRAVFDRYDLYHFIHE